MGPGKGILIALGSGKRSSEMEDEPSAKEGSLSAAKALLKAIKADDAEGVVEAFGLLCDLHESESYEDEDD